MLTWLKRFGRSTSRRDRAEQVRRPRRPRLDLERLEDRTVPVVSALSSAHTSVLADTAAGNVHGIASASKDGRYVVFTDTAANLAPGQVMDSKSHYNVFLHDRSTGVTTLVSHAAGSSTTTARGDSRNPVISADGKWVAYVSNSDNLISNAKLANDTYYVSLGWVTGGTFKLSYDGQTTGAIPHNATASDVQDALVALAGIDSGDVTVSGSGGSTGVYTITFTGALAHGGAKRLTADPAALTHSTSIAAVGFQFAGGHNEFLCDQYAVYLYDVVNGTNTLVSHAASDQGSGYQTLLGAGTSGLLTGAHGSFGASNGLVATQATSVSISGDGKYVVYLSTAANLVKGQQNPHPDLLRRGYYLPANVYVYDRGADTNYLVSDRFNSSTNSDGDPIQAGDYTAFVAVISQDGSTIVFGSQATNLAEDQRVSINDGNGPGETQQWFVTTRPSASTWADAPTHLVSHNTRGNNFESVTNSSGDLVDYPAPAVSADGKWIAYQSSNVIVTLASASNAASGNNFYLYNNDPNSTGYRSNTLVSHTPGTTTTAGNGYTYTYLTTTGPGPAISDDGRFVVFVSRSTNLVSGTTTSAGFNYFVFDRDASDPSNNVTRVSTSSIPTSFVSSTALFHPLTPSISGDGEYIALLGRASGTVSGVTNLNGTAGLDVLLYSVSAGTYTLVSRDTSSASTTSNDNARWAVVSNNGAAVFFASDATNLIPAASGVRTGLDNNAGTDLFAYSRSNSGLNYTPLASTGDNATVTLHYVDPNNSANNLPSLTANGISEISPIGSTSADGRFVVFMSSAANIVSGQTDTNKTLDVFLYDKSSGAVKLLSGKNGSTSETGNGLSTNAVISADGKTVAFYSFATDLISGVTIPANTVQLYIYNNDSASSDYGKLQLVSFVSGGTNGSNGTAPFAPNNSTLLYSATTTTIPILNITTTTIHGLALPSLSADGKYIAYLSNANNLGASNTGTARVHVFLYDRANNTNTLVSGASGATTPTGANNHSSAVAISADGTTVAFFSKASNLRSDAVSGGNNHLYIWSRVDNSNTGLGAGAIVLATHAASNDISAATLPSSAGSLPFGALPPSISDDGKYVAYYFGGSNLVSNQSGTASATNVFRYDVEANTNTLVSHAAGSSSTAGDNPANAYRSLANGPVISANGQFIAYANNSTNLLSTTSPLTGQNGRDNIYLWDASTGTNTLVSHNGSGAATGGTSASISANGRFVAYIDVAPENTDHPDCLYIDTASVRLFDAQGSSSIQPAAVGVAFNPTLMLLFRASLAPTALSDDASVIVWHGLASNNVTGDRNGNLDVFLATNDSVNLSIVTGNNQNTPVDTDFPTQLVVLVTNATNDPIAGASVTFTAPGDGPSGTFTGSGTSVIVTTNSNGLATAPVFTANTKSGSYTVTATLTGTSTSVQFSLTNDPGTPQTIEPGTNDPIIVPVDSVPTTPFSVTVIDPYGNGVPGVSVTFTAPTSTGTNATGTFGTSNTAIVTTNASGVATAPTFTANTKAGGYTVTATVTGLTGVNFGVTNTAGPADAISNVTSLTQSVTVNTGLSNAFTVLVVDNYGNAVSGVDVTFAVTASGGAGGAFSGASSIVVATGANGTATAPTLTAGTVAGAYTVTATVAGVSTGINFGVTNLPGAAAVISNVTSLTQSVTVNTGLANAFTVLVVDSFGNAVSGVDVTFAVTPSGGAGGAFSGASSVVVATGANGTATAPTLTAGTVAGTYTVSATADGVTDGVDFSVTNLPGAAAVISNVTGLTQSVTVNTALSNAFTVLVVDSFGNAVSGVDVTFAVAASGAAGGAFSGASSVVVATGANGTATAPTLTANTRSGSYTVTASAAGVSTGVTFNVTNNPGAATTITATSGTPQNVTVNTTALTAFQATVTDQFGNAVPGVSVTFVAPTGSGAGGNFGGSATSVVTTNASGVATAGTFTANTVAGSYTVTAGAAGVGTDAVFSLTNLPGAATLTNVSPLAQSVTVNTAATPFKVLAVDQFNNPVAGVDVTFAAPGTVAGAGGTFAAGASVIVTTGADGTATSPALLANTVTGTYSVTVSAAGASGGVNFTVTNTPGAAAKVTAVPPATRSLTVNTGSTAPFEVTVRDAFDNLVGAGVTVTFAAPISGASGTFANGTATIVATTNAGGFAQVTGFTANTVAGSYLIIASVASGTADGAFSMTNTPGAAQIVALTGTPQSAVTGSTFATALQARVQDAFGNLFVGVAVTFTAPSSGAGATFPGGTSSVVVTTNASGVVTAPAVTANATAGSYLITATSGTATPAQFALTNVAPVKPPVVHVNPAWVNVPIGSDPDGPGPATFFGPGGDAFATLVDADAQVAVGGTLILAGGTYTGAVNVTNAGSVILAGNVIINTQGGNAVFNAAINSATAGGADLTLIAGGGDVSFNQPVGASAALKSLTISGADDVFFAGAVNVTGDLTQTGGTGKTTFNGGEIGGTLSVTTGEVVFASGTTSAAAVLIHVQIAAVIEGDAVLKSAGKVEIVIGSSSGATVNLEGAVDAPSVSILGGNGPDTILLSPRTGAAIVVDAGAGSNLLQVDLSGVAGAQTVLLGAESITGTALPQGLQYRATGGNFGRGVTVMTGAGDDSVYVLGTQAGAPTKVMTGAGNDQVLVTSSIDLARSALTTLASELTIDAGAGANSLVISEAARTEPEALFVTDTTLGGSLIGAPIRYAATGGSFAGGFTLIAGSAGDTIVILGAPAGAPLIVYAGDGDDVIQVAPSAGKPLTSLAIDAGAGFDRLAILPQSEGAVVRDYRDSGAALFRVSYLGDDVSTIWYGGVEDTGASVTQEQSFVQGLYHTALGWNASDADLNFWVGLLNSGVGKDQVAAAIASSPAALSKTVRDWYEDYLGFTPAAGEEQWLVQAMLAGLPREDALSLLLGSPLYYGQSGNTDATFVTAVFEDLLGGKPSDDQLNIYLSGLLPRLGRDGVAWLILSSEQHRRAAIGDTIGELFGRPATLAEVDSWAASPLTLEEIRVRLVLSGDFV